jgi:DNA-binding response OmpR family regulator
VRLLVVEDETTMAESLKAGLEAEGFAVDVAGDGAEALWYAEEATYDAIILDLMLPKVNGFVVCRTLRERGDWTPVLMLTAKDGHLDEAEGLDIGADDYLAKPFAFVVLLARLRALLRRRSRTRPASLQVGSLVVDPAARRASRTIDGATTELELTSKEFSILEVLVTQAGDVVSKSDIMSRVWDFNFDGDPNIVEVYIRSLRKKIDIPFGLGSIETVRGAGYRLRGEGEAS